MDYVISDATVTLGDGDAPPASGTPGAYSSGTPGSSLSTELPAYQMNAIEQEIVNTIVGAGLIKSRFNNAQLLAAIIALASGTGSLTGNGSLKMPGGLLLQWGIFHITTAANTGQQFSWPTAFPTEVWGCLGTDNGNVGSGGNGAHIVGASPDTGSLTTFHVNGFDPSLGAWSNSTEAFVVALGK